MGIYTVTSLFLTVLSEMFHLVGVISSKWPCHCWLVEETNPHGHTRARAQIRPRVLDLFQVFVYSPTSEAAKLTISGWWLEHEFYDFPIILGIIIIPSDDSSYFQRGRAQPWLNHQPDLLSTEYQVTHQSVVFSYQPNTAMLPPPVMLVGLDSPQ